MSKKDRASLLKIKQEDCVILEEYREPCTSFKTKTRAYYLIQTPFGNCRIRKDAYPSKLPNISSALHPTKYFIKQANKVHEDTYDYSLTEYVGSNCNLDIVCKVHGIFKQSANTHLSGKGCPSCGILKRNLAITNVKADFQNISDQINNSEYSVIGKYLNNRTKIEILHKTCGKVFKQTPASHSQGHGCPYCNKSSGWRYTEWEELAKKSKQFDSFKVYVVILFKEETKESFIKVGRTFKKLEQRLRTSKSMTFSYKIIKEIIFTEARECCEYEKVLLQVFQKYSYKPTESFHGSCECFNIKDIKEIESFINR